MEIESRTWWEYKSEYTHRIFLFVGSWKQNDGILKAELWEVGKKMPIIYPYSEFELYIKDKLLIPYKTE